MDTTAEKKAPEIPDIDVETAMDLFENECEESGAYDRAKSQRLRYGALYLAILALIICTPSYLAFQKLHPIAGGIILVVFSAIWAIVVIPRSNITLETNELAVIKVLKTAFRIVPSGLQWFFYPIEKPHNLGVSLQEVEIELKVTVDIRGSEPQKDGKSKGAKDNRGAFSRGHPPTRVDLTMKLTVRVLSVWRYLFVMAHETAEEKIKVMESLAKDFIQSLINEDSMTLEDTLTLEGVKILEDIRIKIAHMGRTFDTEMKRWGLFAVSMVIDDTDIPEETKKALQKGFEGYMEGQSFLQMTRNMAAAVFSKELEELDKDELRRLSEVVLTKLSFDAVSDTDKMIFGGPRTLQKAIEWELAAEYVKDK